MQHPLTPKDELNYLLNDAIKMAIRLIEAHGHHVPFGMILTTIGERIDIAADDTETRDYDVLFEAVRKRINEGVHQGRSRAVALVKNVSVCLRQNEISAPAVQIMLDHERGKACTCYLPYRIENGRVISGEIFATDAVQHFFPHETEHRSER